MIGLTISPATEQDVATLYSLTVSLAQYEKKTADQILVTEDKLRKWAFGRHPVFHALIARLGEKPVGMAVYYYGYSGYMGSAILYLEDLFVLPDYRRQSIGTRMLKMLGQYALERDCCRMQWAVFDWNTEASDFYRSIGAEFRPDLIQVRLNSDNLRKFLDG